jgi:hypothetical protein
MRLLIYLLALMSGFSAADAARADVAHSSAVAQTAVVVADALVTQEQQQPARPVTTWPRDLAFAPMQQSAPAYIALTPITRGDISQQ